MNVARRDPGFEVGDLLITAVKNGRWRENAYVVFHKPSREAVLIDPGGDANRLTGLINELGGEPKFILLTHAHFDHVGALDAMCRAYGLPFHLHRGDFRLLRRATLYAMSFDRTVVTVPETHVFLDEAKLSGGMGQIGFIHTPGHTDGGVCYHWDGVCFTGDTLMKRLVGRTDLPGSSGEGLAQSISRLLETLPPDTLMFPGHGGPWTVAEACDWWAGHKDAPPEYAMEGMLR